MSWSNRLQRYFNLWVLVASIAVGLGLACLTLGVLWYSRPTPAAPANGTAVLSVIQLPSATAVVNTPTPANGPSSTEALPPPPPGEIAKGAYVQVTGTGGDGVRLRSEPTLNGEVLLLGLESEVFLVSDGPAQADGYTWWYLVAPYDDAVRGWAVANYLGVVQNP